MPFGVQGSNIDLILRTKNKPTRKITTFVFELKRGKLNRKEWESAGQQVSTYAEYIKRAQASYKLNYDVVPVVLSGMPKRGFCPHPYSDVIWLGYQITSDRQVKISAISQPPTQT